jgi:hypothetical protein
MRMSVGDNLLQCIPQVAFHLTDTTIPFAATIGVIRGLFGFFYRSRKILAG